MWACCSRRRGQQIAPTSFAGIATEADGGEQIIGLERKFHFESSGAIREGWIKSKTPAPKGFSLAGGDAIVIEKEEPGKCQRCVLLALPELAVDLKRAKWLSRRMGFLDEASLVCHLRRSIEVKPMGATVLEFDYPLGTPLCDFLKQGNSLPAEAVWQLCRDVFGLTSFMAPAPGGSAPLRFCGLIHPSTILVDEDGRLQSVLPIGCVLSWAGACALWEVLKRKREDACLAPELKVAAQKNLKLYFADSAALFERAFAADGFAAAMLMLRSLGMETVDSAEVTERLSTKANDFLLKAFHKEKEFRLCGPDALSHPWITNGIGLVRA